MYQIKCSIEGIGNSSKQPKGGKKCLVQEIINDNISTYCQPYFICLFSILIDPKANEILEGITVDYQKSGLNEGFEFNNPNSKAECGCGESFTV